MKLLKRLFTGIESMDPEQARVYMNSRNEGTFVLLDVRQPGEYEENHIPGAKLIPLPDLQASSRELNPDKPIIVY
jgi:rhodanese-related sulfurtransferase